MPKRRVTMDAFIRGDVYIDYPYEQAKFRFEKQTNAVYRRWYGESETRIPNDSELYHEAHSGGWAITRDEYFRDEAAIEPGTPPAVATHGSVHRSGFASGASWTASEWLDRIASAIDQTRTRLHEAALGDVIDQLEDLAARVRAHDALDDDYLSSLSFDVIAHRELEDSAAAHDSYLALLSRLASQIRAAPPRSLDPRIRTP